MHVWEYITERHGFLEDLLRRAASLGTRARELLSRPRSDTALALAGSGVAAGRPLARRGFHPRSPLPRCERIFSI